MSYLTGNFPFLAQQASQSLGRLLPEEPHAFRNCFQRDRDRIVHSTAFRRLDGKTQVFLNGQGDYYRTRLTHTIEVASISRTIARALGLNEDLSEAIALAHDLGHPPSGHAGERTLHELMRDYGGFDHNEQSLRVVTLLEESYPQHSGLNLSYEVLEGLRKHHTHFHPPAGKPHSKPSLEAQLVDVADEIAYYSHDLDDGMEAGLLTLPELEKLTLWKEAQVRAVEEIGASVKRETILKNRKFILRCLINHQVEELLASSKAIITAAHVRSAEEARCFPQSLIRFSKEHQQKNRELRHFLYEHFYRHPSVAATNQEACERIIKIFNSFIAEPGHYLGERFFKRLEKEGKHRVICDYIAGMTDRYVKMCVSANVPLTGTV